MDNVAAIQQQFSNDFTLQFQCAHNTFPPLRNLNIPFVVTMEDNQKLMKPVTGEEIHEASLQMDPYNAPRPNGFSVAFYQ